MTSYGDLTPVNIVTGFLGSGKTTLLQRLLRSPQLSDALVLVNEFGEVGLDHHLLQGVAESTLLLENGCLCCAVRGDHPEGLAERAVPERGVPCPCVPWPCRGWPSPDCC